MDPQTPNALPPIPPLPSSGTEMALAVGELRSWRPRLPVILVAITSLCVGVAIAMTVAFVVLLGRGSSPAPYPEPTSQVDEAFIPLGEAYGPGLSVAYGEAWAAGAESLDRGTQVGKALDEVASRWTTSRKKLLASEVEPRFAQIVPEAEREQNITPAKRRALAAGWRGFAAGLNGGTLPRVSPAPPAPEPRNSPLVAPVPEPSKGNVQPTQVKPDVAAVEPEKAPKSRIESVAAEKPPTSRIETVAIEQAPAKAIPSTYWRVRPSDERVEDFGFEDESGRFVSSRRRWREGYEPRQTPVVRYVQPTYVESPRYLSMPATSYSFGGSSSCASGARPR